MRTFLAVCLFAVAASAAADCASYTYCQFWGGACANGTRQSPIANNAANRTANAALPVPGLTSYAVRTKVWAANTKTTVKVTTAKTISLGYPGGPWTLEEFHFHVPAEHVLDVWNNGRRPAAELHLVHKNPAKTQAVAVAVPIYLGTSSNQALHALRALGALPANCDPKESGLDAVPMQALLPSNTARYITYEGSLTTPQCDEVVRFLLMNGGITATQDEINYIKITMNARPAQYNTRPVTYRP
jgi:carbonic anhydrase